MIDYKIRFEVLTALAVLDACFMLGFVVGLLLVPEDGSEIFLRNVCLFSKDYMVLYPRR
jgi:hypothetical protein